jgi:hypothetical protein
MDGKFIAYYRISTDHQGIEGNGILAQQRAVVGGSLRPLFSHQTR